MRGKLGVWAFIGLVLWPGFAAAAIIGPTDDWKPLRVGARDLGVSEDTIKRIVAAGVGISCPGTEHGNGGALNGWFLGADAAGLYTNAHGVIDIGTDKKANLIEPLDDCRVRSYRDLMSSGAKATAYPLNLPNNRDELALGTFNPQTDVPYKDRAHLMLMRAVLGAKALPLPDLTKLPLTVGEEIILVSLRPPAMREPEIQACHIRAITQRRGMPGLVLTDCDNDFGNSAGLYMVRDPSSAGALVPVALHESCHQKLGDHKDWNAEDNTAIGILFGTPFFQFASR